jgi:hypothetical protein
VRENPGREWIDQAVPAVEAAIDELIDEFLDNPYLHRVEHSLHIRLYELLVKHAIFSKPCPIGSTGRATQLIHKEWPETVPRSNKSGRGNFDLVILAPNQLLKADLVQFVGGHIEAAIAIEVGLNYGYIHLANDHNKLLSSDVRHGYLVDLRRVGRSDEASETFVCNVASPVKTAYAHSLRRGTAFKHVDDRKMTVNNVVV